MLYRSPEVPTANESTASAPAAKKAQTKRNLPPPTSSAEENSQVLGPVPPHSVEDTSDQLEDEGHYTCLYYKAERKAIERELNNYMMKPCHFEGTDVEYETILAYWNLAMTVLAVPATSVPSEQVFSSIGRTDTPEHNKLSPMMMEALQVLKFDHRSRALDYPHNYLESMDDLEWVLLEEMTEELRDNILEALTNN